MSNRFTFLAGRFIDLLIAFAVVSRYAISTPNDNAVMIRYLQSMISFVDRPAFVVLITQDNPADC